VKQLHDGRWWQAATRRFDFTKPDALDSAAFNRVLWKGIVGGHRPYPSRGADKD
jgi:hypothetical protein